MNPLFLVADRNSAANQWLRENPLVLSGIFGVIGLVLLVIGIMEIRSGKSTDKYGNEMTGGLAFFSAMVRVVAGGGMLCAAIYISIFGAW